MWREVGASSCVGVFPPFVFSYFYKQPTFIYGNIAGHNNKQKVKIKNGSIKGVICVLTLDNG